MALSNLELYVLLKWEFTYKKKLDIFIIVMTYFNCMCSITEYFFDFMTEIT